MCARECVMCVCVSVCAREGRLTLGQIIAPALHEGRASYFTIQTNPAWGDSALDTDEPEKLTADRSKECHRATGNSVTKSTYGRTALAILSKAYNDTRTYTQM